MQADCWAELDIACNIRKDKKLLTNNSDNLRVMQVSQYNDV